MWWTMICPPAVIFCASIRELETLQINLCAARCQLCALLFVGNVFPMVCGAIAAGLQSEAMARGVEEDAL